MRGRGARGRAVGIACVLAIALAGIGVAWGDSVPSLVREGNRLYEEGRFAEALERYRRAAEESPGLAPLHLNMGNALYRLGEFEQAYEAYRQAFAAGEAPLAQGARFNAGNTRFAQERWQEAIEQYREALTMNPEDGDAKRNLELAMQRLMEQQQQEQPRPQQPDDPNQPQQDPQPPAPRPQQGEGDRPQDPANPQEGEAPPTEAPREDQDLSREEAMRILDAMKDRDKPPKEQLKVRPPERRPEKDW